MSDTVLVAIIGGSFVLVTTIVQAVAVRINSRQHGNSLERLDRIENAQTRVATVATELLEHREKSQEYRDLQTTRHEQNVERLQVIDSHIDAVNGHVRALDERVKHLEGDHP